MEDDDPPGLAVLGNQLIFDPQLHRDIPVLITALDHDSGGYGGFYNLGERYPGKGACFRLRRN